MPVEIMIFTGIGLIVTLVAGYFLMRYLKGSIKLKLPQTSFSGGDTVKAHFTLTAKQGIEGNKLLVCLTADEINKSRNNDGNDTSETDEIYRDEIILEDSKHYPKGFTQEYSFEIEIPNSSESSMDGSKLGQALNTVGALLNTNRRYLEWNIEVRLDAKGVDLSDSERIYIK